MMGAWCVTDLEVGERVVHYRDPDLRGALTAVEENRLSVMARWDGDSEDDFQWANKVVRENAL
jgi:hypothetical protein